MMKLLIVIVHTEDAHHLADTLVRNGNMCTKLSSTGGFLRQGNTTFLIGVEEEMVDSVLDILKETCRPRKSVVDTSSYFSALNGNPIPQWVETETGGATVFVLNTADLVKL